MNTHHERHFAPTKTPSTLRQQEIVEAYLALLDAHMHELRSGEADGTHSIEYFAEKLHMHPRHLSNTLHESLGQSPCDLYEQRLLEVAKELILAGTQPIAHIARQMHYDPSNFGKFFKHYTGLTPMQFRKGNP